MVNKFDNVQYPDIADQYNLRYLRENLLEASWFDPRELLLVIYDDKVAGYAYMWLAMDMHRLRIEFDPYMSHSYIHMLLDIIMKFVRDRVLVEKGNSLVRVVLSYEYRFLHNVLKQYLLPIYIDYTGSLMKLNIEKYGSIVREDRTSNIRFRFGSLELVKDVVEIYNDAFSKYPWFTPWVVEDAERYYDTHGLKCFVAYVDDDPAGYVDFMVYKNIRGEKVSYIYTLAVKNKYQGKGLGKALTREAIQYLINNDIYDIYLDAVGGLEKLYSGLGFVTIARSVSYIISI